MLLDHSISIYELYLLLLFEIVWITTYVSDFLDHIWSTCTHSLSTKKKAHYELIMLVLF